MSNRNRNRWILFLIAAFCESKEGKLVEAIIESLPSFHFLFLSLFFFYYY